MKHITSYRLPLFLLVLLGALLFGQGAGAQVVNDFERELKTEKQKKRTKKKKRKDPDHSPRDRVVNLRKKPQQHDPKPGFYRTDKEKKHIEEIPTIEGRAARHLMRERPRKVGQPKGTAFGGRLRPPKGGVKEPGTHYTERSEREGKEAAGSRGTQHQGSLSVKRREVDEPGKVYDKKEREKGARRRDLRGTDSQGDLTVKRRNIDQPGVVYTKKDREKALRRQKLPGTNHQGQQTVKASERVAPGTHHSERNEKAGQRYSSYNATRHGGNNSVKTKYVKEPGTHWSERKASFARQYSSTPATSHEGNRRMMTQRQKMVYYGDLSEKMNQYRGNLKIRKRDADMHPSVVARYNRLRSDEQRAKARKRSNTINRIFTSKQQPKTVKAKPMKPRYDKGESEIWYE